MTSQVPFSHGVLQAVELQVSADVERSDNDHKNNNNNSVSGLTISVMTDVIAILQHQTTHTSTAQLPSTNYESMNRPVSRAYRSSLQLCFSPVLFSWQVYLHTLIRKPIASDRNAQMRPRSPAAAARHQRMCADNESAIEETLRRRPTRPIHAERFLTVRRRQHTQQVHGVRSQKDAQ